jgi:hypothetical protein
MQPIPSLKDNVKYAEPKAPNITRLARLRPAECFRRHVRRGTSDGYVGRELGQGVPAREPNNQQVATSMQKQTLTHDQNAGLVIVLRVSHHECRAVPETQAL